MSLDDLIARFDVGDPAFIADPYPALAAIREATPVFRNPATGQWTLTRFSDVQETLRDRRLGRANLQRRASLLHDRCSLFRGSVGSRLNRHNLRLLLGCNGRRLLSLRHCLRLRCRGLSLQGTRLGLQRARVLRGLPGALLL